MDSRIDHERRWGVLERKRRQRGQEKEKNKEFRRAKSSKTWPKWLSYIMIRIWGKEAKLRGGEV